MKTYFFIFSSFLLMVCLPTMAVDTNKVTVGVAIDSTVVMAENTVLVNGVVKSRIDLPNNGKYFEYTTPDNTTLYHNLKNTSQQVPYEKLFPEGTEHIGPTKKLLVFRDFVYNSFCRNSNIKKQLAGKRIRITICVKPDGTTLLKGIICADDLLNYVSAESIKQLISIVTSYRFAVSNVSEKYYIMMSAVITVPN